MDDEAHRLRLPATVIPDQLDVAAGVCRLTGLDLGEHVLRRSSFEERELPHGPVMVTGGGLLGVFDGGHQPLLEQVMDLPKDLLRRECREVGEGLELHARTGSSRSTPSNSKLISFQRANASRSSDECRAACSRMSLPSRLRSRPSLRAWTTASRATRLAEAPAAFPPGCPCVPPPHWKTASSPKMLTRSGICQTWIPPDAAGNTAGREAQGWSKYTPRLRSAGTKSSRSKSLIAIVPRRSPSSFPTTVPLCTWSPPAIRSHLASTRQWMPWFFWRSMTACRAR